MDPLDSLQSTRQRHDLRRMELLVSMPAVRVLVTALSSKEGLDHPPTIVHRHHSHRPAFDTIAPRLSARIVREGLVRGHLHQAAKLRCSATGAAYLHQLTDPCALRNVGQSSVAEAKRDYWLSPLPAV